MGMFDYVNFKMPCPSCGTEITGWQTKSTDCTMTTVDPTAAANFYGDCDKCGLWIDFSRVFPGTPARPVPFTPEEVQALGFTMSTRPSARRKQ